MKEPQPPSPTSAPKISPRTSTEKITRGIFEFALKELGGPIAAAALSWLATAQITNYIDNQIGAPAIEKKIIATETEIKDIRKRQEEMGKIPEWFDRVIRQRQLTSSVNALEVKLKALQASKSSAEGVKPYLDFLVFGIIFSILVGYTRQWIEKILDAKNKNWRERKIVDEVNESLILLHERITEIELKLARLNSQIGPSSDLDKVKSEMLLLIEEFKENSSKLDKNE